ncbi:MAG: 4Fe-4S binding protein [Candidatus Hodarchaeales archaeon]|jgi:heterodisulfide reductase subunit A
MTAERKIGVFICHCGTNIAEKVNIQALTEFAKGLPGVKVAKEYLYMCSETGQSLIQDTIKEEGIDRVVVTACSPTLHEKTFRKASEAAGVNPYLFQMGNIREAASWISHSDEDALLKAKRVLAAAVARVQEQQPLHEEKLNVRSEVLVVGGGIAGMEAALRLADAGSKVYLVEKEPSIGGRMAQFDKTFPTLDCSACILTPKMAEVGSHPNINILSYSEVRQIEGNPGDFTVTVHRHARYVREDRCNGCGLCTTKCPRKRIPSEFDEGIGNRTAIYRPFPQAIPNYPVIDRDNCLFFKYGRCTYCTDNCPVDAIDFEDQPSEVAIQVGTVIIATGFDLYDSSKIKNYHYGEYDNVFTALEFERLLNASGPTGGKILLRNDGSFTEEVPKSVGIIHCVGSRDENHKEYCSRVCCMYALKFAHLVKERTNAEVYNFYIDMRAFGKGYEEFYDRLLKEGVIFVRGKVAEIEENPEGDDLLIKAEDSLLGKFATFPVDMVVLCPAMIPAASTDPIASVCTVGRSSDGFLQELHPKMAPVEAISDGFFLVGACQGPKDIPDSVAQGAAAAAAVLSLIGTGLVIEPTTSSVDSDVCSGCKTCIGLCPYSAISHDPENKVAVVDSAKCKGCGICVSVCPSGAIHQDYYSDEALRAEIIGALRVGAD